MIVALAIRHPDWGHRKIWGTARQGGYRVWQSSVLRILDDAGLLLKADYQRERRQLSRARKSALAAPPTGPNMAWQLHFSEYETTGGGTWRVGGIADYWSKCEFGWHWSPTANQHDAVAAVELALAEAGRLLDGPTLLEYLTDPDTGEIVPITLVTDNVVTDNGGPFRSLVSARSSPPAPSCAHIRTGVRTPGQNGVEERVSAAELRVPLPAADRRRPRPGLRGRDVPRRFNQIRPHEALSWNRPADVHQGRVDPATPTFPEADSLPSS